MAMYLVTGGAGFIGSHLVEALLERGQAVRVFDNFSTGCRDNLAAMRDRIDLVEGDIRDLEAVSRAMEGVEVVLHQAALPSVPRSIKDPIASHAVNATGTLNVLEAARQNGVRRVVYASSSSVYGDTPVLPKHEDLTPRPLSPYAASKLAGEHYCHVFAQVYGLETVVLRYFNVFGPRQDPDSPYAAVIPAFISKMLHGEAPTIYGDGEQSRDFTYIANVVEANLRAAEVALDGPLVVNCAVGGRTSLNELVAALNRVLGTALEPAYAAPRLGDVKHSYAAIDRTRTYLGYEPVVGLQDGLAYTAAAHRNGAVNGRPE